MDTGASIRFECLRLALSHGNYETDTVLNRAKAYSEFTLSGRTATADNQPYMDGKPFTGSAEASQKSPCCTLAKQPHDQV